MNSEESKGFSQLCGMAGLYLLVLSSSSESMKLLDSSSLLIMVEELS